MAYKRDRKFAFVGALAVIGIFAIPVVYILYRIAFYA